MKNKGFTLVELLTIIVILALIILTALPKVLNIVSGSANKSWKSSVKLLRTTIQKNIQLYNSKTGVYKYTVDDFCTNPNKLKEIADFSDVSITCTDNLFILTGTGRFDGKTGKIMCNDTECDSCITADCEITTIKLPPKREDKSFYGKVLNNTNTTILTNPDLTKTEPYNKTVYVENIGTQTSKSLSTTARKYYYTYASSYTLDENTGKYTLVNPQTCKYSSCYSTLRNKYVVSTSGTSSSSAANSKDLSTIYQVTSSSSSSKLYYKTYTSKTSTSDQVDLTKSGMYSMEVTNGFSNGVSGTTYYYRGKVDNNYLSFAGMMWRIVRINEDRSIRIILQDGLASPNMFSRYQANNYNYLYYTNSTVIKSLLDNWYNDNIVALGYDTKVSSGNYFCEALALGGGSKIMNVNTIKPSNYTPNLSCVTDANGKGLVNSSVGLITYDEVILAGCTLNANGTLQFYLNNGKEWWTMTPAGYEGTTPRVFANYDTIYASGILENIHFADAEVDNTHYVRPVINLKSSVSISGSGTLSDPYTIN